MTGRPPSHRRLGRSDLWVHPVGLGCMSLLRPDDGEPASRPARAVDLVRRALDLGVNLFDTADLYDHGDNERVVGRALRGVRERVVLASKVGNRWREDGDGWDWVPDPAYLRSAVHASLRRLGTDYLDLVQLHGGTIDDPIEDIVGLFEDLVREGTVRAYGLSSIRPNVIRAFLDVSRAARAGPASVMLQYSVLDRRPEEEVLGLLEGSGVAAIARGPLAQGLLLGGAPRPYLDQSEEEVASTQGALAQLAPGAGGPVRAALRFALEAPSVAAVVPGARTLAQLEANVAAAAGAPLSAGARAVLERAAPPRTYRLHR